MFIHFCLLLINLGIFNSLNQADLIRLFQNLYSLMGLCREIYKSVLLKCLSQTWLLLHTIPQASIWKHHWPKAVSEPRIKGLRFSWYVLNERHEGHGLGRPIMGCHRKRLLDLHKHVMQLHEPFGWKSTILLFMRQVCDSWNQVYPLTLSCTCLVDLLQYNLESTRNLKTSIWFAST